MSGTPAGLAADLQRVGAPITDLWELVNTRAPYPAAVPVLVDWLRHLGCRVPAGERASVREGLVRALSVPAARPAAAPVLIDEFRRLAATSDLGIGWVVGNALSVVADDSVFDDISEIVQDRRYGKARQMVVLGLARSHDPRAVPLLIGLLDDEEVVAHAVMALGKRRADQARPAIERLRDHPQALVRREVKKALAKLGP